MTRDDALLLAQKYGLKEEIEKAMDSGISPLEACSMWDIL